MTAEILNLFGLRKNVISVLAAAEGLHVKLNKLYHFIQFVYNVKWIRPSVDRKLYPISISSM